MALSYTNYVGNLLYASGGVAVTLRSTSPGATLTGGSTNDSLADVTGGSILVGGAGDDTYYISDPKTQVVEAANGGVDTVATWTNHTLEANVENITARADNLTIAGNVGNNILTATGARDVLWGGGGADVFIDAGAGQERFMFAPGGGQEVVMGFQTAAATHDYIGLGGYGFTTFAQVQSHMTQVGSDTLLTLSTSDAVLLKGVSVASLTASDFLLNVDTSQMKMTFDEEFNNLSLWNPSTGTGVWKTNYLSGAQSGANVIDSHTLKPNGEIEVYVDPTFAGTGKTALGLNPFSITNGVLSITASKTPAADLSVLGNYQYTSGLLTTEKSFSQTYGYFEIKAELPADKGAWPAFWLLPTDGTWPPELDVMEQIGGSSIYQSAHSNATGTQTSTTFTSAVNGATTGFHTYGMLWTASTITWYVDGSATAEIATPADMKKPMYLLLDLAVGGSWAGAPDASLTSTNYKIDYVHVFSLDQSPVTAPPVTAPVITEPPVAPVTPAAPVTTAPSVSDELDSSVSATLGATQHTLVLTGAAAINGTGNDLGDHLTGNSAANTLTGGAGNDVIDGGKGADIMIGGKGDDIYYVDSSADQVIEKPGEGNDTVMSAVTYTLPDNVENLVLLYTGDSSGNGNALDNHITGNDGNNILDGKAGNDVIDGGKGNDTIIGGAGDDTLTGGAGNDTFQFALWSGHDTITDFGSGGDHDIIDVSAWLAKGYHPTVTDSASGLTLTFDAADSIHLLGVHPSQLITTAKGYTI